MAQDSPLSSFEVGEGFPILFIHGWQLNGKAEAFDFEPIFSDIPGFRRIYIDLPGHGSTPAHNIQSQDDVFDHLKAFVNSRLGSSNFLLVGSSCGGYLARVLAQRYARQINGLLLRVPLIEPEDSKRDVDAFEPVVRDEQVMSSLSAEDKKTLGNVLTQEPKYIEALKAKYDGAYLPAERAADKTVLEPIRADAQRYRLSDFDGEDEKFLGPTLIICGRQDEVVGYRDSLRLLEFYPRSTFAVLDRATHGLPVDDHDRSLLEALVRDWIFRVHESRSHAGSQ